MSHHQGHVKYGRSARMQCTRNAYLAIIFLIIKNITIWKPFDHDSIFGQGNRVFKDADMNQALAVDELPLSISIEVFIFLQKCLSMKVICLLKEVIYLQITEIIQRVKEALGPGIGILWWDNSVIIFDSHSRNTDGYHDPNGKGLQLEF